MPRIARRAPSRPQPHGAFRSVLQRGSFIDELSTLTILQITKPLIGENPYRPAIVTIVEQRQGAPAACCGIISSGARFCYRGGGRPRSLARHMRVRAPAPRPAWLRADSVGPQRAGSTEAHRSLARSSNGYPNEHASQAALYESSSARRDRP